VTSFAFNIRGLIFQNPTLKIPKSMTRSSPLTPSLIFSNPASYNFARSNNRRLIPVSYASEPVILWRSVYIAHKVAMAEGRCMETPTSQLPVDDGTIDDRRITVRDRRKTPRRMTLQGAQIISRNDVPVPCTVRNLSEAGAKLEVYRPVIQNTFVLVFNLDQSRRSCRVVWRKDSLIGVRFM
jgi:PilZ domain